MPKRSGVLRRPESGPFEGILLEPLREDETDADVDETDADVEARFKALFDHYGIECPNTDDWTELYRLRHEAWKWEGLAMYLAFDLLTCMSEARPVGRPRKLDFSDRDAIIWFELACASMNIIIAKNTGRKPGKTVRGRAKDIAIRLGDISHHDSVTVRNKATKKVVDRFYALKRRAQLVKADMYGHGKRQVLEAIFAERAKGQAPSDQDIAQRLGALPPRAGTETRKF